MCRGPTTAPRHRNTLVALRQRVGRRAGSVSPVARLAPRRALLVVLVAAAEAAAYVVVRLAGVGGYRSGRELAVAAILVAGGATAFLCTRDIDDAADRAIWLTAAAIVAVTLGVQVASVAPPSKGRLVQQLDGLTLPFFVTRSTTTRGHSWCRPECPSVRRVYDAPPTSVGNALATLVAGLANDGVIPKAPISSRSLESGTVRSRTAELNIDLRVRRQPASGKTIPPLKVQVRLSAR